jgi:hypothetical protein
MGIKSFLVKPYAAYVAACVKRWSSNAVAHQHRMMHYLVENGAETAYGKDHQMHNVRRYEDFKRAIPLRDYEQLKPYIDRVVEGEKDVLWHGKPKYFAKTSGTTSGVKYIPITSSSVDNHYYSAQTAIMLFMHGQHDTSMMDGNLLFLSGSPELEEKNGIKTGRLSGIVNHEIPGWLKRNQVPSWETNCIDDWETKVDRIADETLKKDMRLISGIPPWLQMYFDRLHEKTNGKRIIEIFPNLKVISHGGVNFEPYRAKLEQSIGRKVPTVETYPASEGFIAYQDSQHAEGLLLNVNSGIFFEFVPANEIFNENPKRLSLNEVEAGVNYAIIINSNAGLWGYVIGDTVKFVNLNPYRIIVTGRIKHFISAFGEHVIAEEIEHALMEAVKKQHAEVTEFTVAPKIQTVNELPYHEWWIELGKKPDDLATFAYSIDDALRKKNIYYNDLIEGKILQPLKIKVLKKGAFIEYMKAKGKLGGQNKVPRLSNNRTLVDELEKFLEN